MSFDHRWRASLAALTFCASSQCLAQVCEVTCPPGALPNNEKCGEDKGSFCSGSIGTCDGPFADCCDAHETPGCSDATCTASVCSYDAFCCDVVWDGLCASEACADPNCDCEPISLQTTLAPGDAFCGEVWADGQIRDVDPFQVNIPEGGLCVWSIDALVPMRAIITNHACVNVEILANVAGDCPVAIAVLDPGQYYAYAMTIGFDGVPCGSGSNAYVATLTCDACFTDIDDSGSTDVNDLLIVINGWGPCEKPPCASDVDVNQTTNVDDLIHVINRWGDCP